MPTRCQTLIAATALFLVGCSTGTQVPSRVRMADETRADLGEAEATYVESDPLNFDFTDLTAIAAEGERVVVADGKRLFEVRTDRSVEEIAEAPEPVAALALSQGKTYLASRSAVYEATEGGIVALATVPSTEKAEVVSLASDGQSLWVADAGNRVVWRFDSSGRLLGQFGKAGNGYDGMVVPSPHMDVAFDPKGAFLSVNPGRHRIEFRRADGTVVRSIGKGGSAFHELSGCCNPTDVTLLPDGRIVTAEKGLVRIKVYDRDGTMSQVVATPKSFDAETLGLDLACDGNGRIWVLDRSRQQVRVFVETNP